MHFTKEFKQTKEGLRLSSRIKLLKMKKVKKFKKLEKSFIRKRELIEKWDTKII